MTLDEAREVLSSAAWAHETPLVALFDEIVKLYSEPIIDRATGKEYPGKIARAFAGYVSSGRVVQLLISLRQQYGLPLYELLKVDEAGTGS